MDCKLSATHNDMPGSDKRLRVWGTCQCPTPGYRLSLREGNAGTPGDPTTYVLELVAVEPSGSVS